MPTWIDGSPDTDVPDETEVLDAVRRGTAVRRM